MSLVDDLKSEIAEGMALVIVGTGVSVQATNGNPLASWKGLLKNGVERCRQCVPSLTDEWEKWSLWGIESGGMNELLSVAENVATHLGAPDGEYGTWLRQTVGALKPVKPDALEALFDLPVRLATTNYDGLLEEVAKDLRLDLSPLTWQDHPLVERVLHGHDRRVIHLHGYWEKPGSVVLGIRSYEDVLRDEHAQAMLSAIRSTKTLVFVGFGAGLQDPNFGAFLRWTRKVFPKSGYRHYRLALQDEVKELQAQHPPAEHISVISYGQRYEDLAAFFRSLAPPKTKPSPPSRATSPARLPPKPLCFGQEELTKDLVDALTESSPSPILVLGGPGIGKSTVTLNALHDEPVKERYGARRYFLRCDTATTGEKLWVEIAHAIGVALSPNLEAHVLIELEREPVLLALDNGETPWEADRSKTEEVFARLAGVPGLALVVTMRGQQRPAEVPWREPLKVPKLRPSDAAEAFLAVAGKNFASDHHLNQLLRAVDHVPFAIMLLARRAQGEPNLEGLWERWTHERTAMLKRTEAVDRLSSLELSHDLSIHGQRMDEKARRLLSLLGLLPDGIGWEEIVALFPDSGKQAASVLRKVGLAFDENRRLCVLAPTREYVSAKYPPHAEDPNRAVAFYAELAREYGPKVGAGEGAEAVLRLAPVIANVEASLLAGLEGSGWLSCIDAGLGLGVCPTLK